MTNNPAIRSAVRRALIAGALTSAVCYAPNALAQEEEQLEEIVVTGSRIVRQDYSSASPIATVDQELFAQDGAVTVEGVLNSLPQFVPAITSSSNNPSNGGQANVSLRGLGSERTLILIDGRRVVPSNSNGVVDLNIIPAALVKNVEIITGGASAVYGSDAVAGVVNFQLKDYEGLEIGGSWGQTSESDGQLFNISVTGGLSFADGRGSLVGSASFSDRDQILHGDRGFSAQSLGWNGTDFVPRGSATIPQGRFDTSTSNLPTIAAIDSVFGQYGIAAGSVGQATNIGFNTDGTLFSIAPALNFTGDPSLLTNPASFNYNFAPVNALQLPLERTSLFLRGSFDLTESVTAYTQLIHTDYDSFSQLAASPATGLNVPVTNPNIPSDLATILASRPDPNATFRLRRRMLETGPRSRDTNYQVSQVIVGLQGDLVGDWTWDSYFSFGKQERDEVQGGNLSRSAFQQLLEAPDGGQALCGGFNPFGINTISQECADFLAVPAINTRKGNQRVLEASVQGPLADLPAGELRMAAGVTYRADSFVSNFDQVLRSGDVIGFNANDNIRASTNVTEIYGEALIPILANDSAIGGLEATVGFRLSDYSTAGTVDSYKSEVIYSPADVVSLRGTYQRAVRAPSIGELFAPVTQNFPGVEEDPCSNDSSARAGTDATLNTADDPASRAGVESICQAQGIPAAALDAYNFSNDQVMGLSGGNPALKEETADTYSFGVVLDSPAQDGIFANLQASIDLYTIEIEDVIAAVDATTFVSRCYDPAFNPGFDVNNEFCNFFTRDGQTSEIIDATETNQNLASFKTTGIDIQVDWTIEAGPGDLSFNLLATNLLEWERQALPGDAFQDLSGTIGTPVVDSVTVAYPEWKWTFGADYRVGDMGFNLRWRHVDSMTDSDDETFEVDAVDYLDLGASYDFENAFNGSLSGLTARVGIKNATDVDPEIFPANVQANTDPSTYDTLGRRYFVSLNYAFK